MSWEIFYVVQFTSDNVSILSATNYYSGTKARWITVFCVSEGIHDWHGSFYIAKDNTKLHTSYLTQLLHTNYDIKIIFKHRTRVTKDEYKWFKILLHGQISEEMGKTWQSGWRNREGSVRHLVVLELLERECRNRHQDLSAKVISGAYNQCSAFW